jgi:hypothetical protein
MPLNGKYQPLNNIFKNDIEKLQKQQEATKNKIEDMVRGIIKSK